jgi:flagellar basal body-associated protein FliL
MNTNGTNQKLLIVAIILVLAVVLVIAYYLLIFKPSQTSQTPSTQTGSQLSTSIPLEPPTISPSATASPVSVDTEADQNIQAIDQELKNLSDTDFSDNELSDKELGL